MDELLNMAKMVSVVPNGRRPFFSMSPAVRSCWIDFVGETTGRNRQTFISHRPSTNHHLDFCFHELKGD